MPTEIDETLIFFKCDPPQDFILEVIKCAPDALLFENILAPLRHVHVKPN